MKRLTRYAGLIAGASLLTAGLGGCASTPDSDECKLLATAYVEQDELAGPWYDRAAEACEIPHSAGCRGRDSDGHYNMDTPRCQP